ncbi:GTP 3',8-cyclase [Seminavis robusta]|uniref:GTP 3',8-cyclase n=1 Tax=Seminavis robusta TaxID=568900 RepID=A0A9N8EA52_9STRA|nr:GTP 3',8-cyclase [Seminavis robusta]|eukprot:Sro665_g183790.1 GTP 3',8-cyclase (537) ;mRNA; f:10159-11769
MMLRSLVSKSTTSSSRGLQCLYGGGKSHSYQMMKGGRMLSSLEPSMTFGRRRRQELSTSAVPALDEDDYEEEVSPVIIHKTKSNTKAGTGSSTTSSAKPRLHALREQLKKEPPLQSFLNKKNNSNNSATENSNSSTNNQTTLHWRELLERSQETEYDDSELLQQREQPAAAAAVRPVLTDRFGRHHNYLRISLAERCNLRCTYCMPPEGVPLQPQSQLLQTPEILSLARHFYNHGVTKIRLTGGEPTLRKDLLDILQGLNDIGRNDRESNNNNRSGLDELAITTNGVTLAKHLDAYIDAGLNRVNISLDTLLPDKFAQLTRRPASYYDRVWESIEAAAAKAPHELVTKINVVVMNGVNQDEVADFCALQKQFPNLHVRFIEYMPFTENGWNMDKWVPYRDLLQQLEQQDHVQLVKLPELDPNDTTKWYTTLENSTRMNGDKNLGRIGFITSMSQPFCGTCNRLRLTSDGQIKVCLFDGNSTISLRDAMREGANGMELDQLIQHALRKKHFSLGGHSSPEHILADSDQNRPMTLIGG